ncbi:MAG: PIN domain-containing protein [Planctomycetaceae bacterium]|jgi:predicted nucleic acid-binding protein|nr:PIN domain-containing protein [Planctomycetaceae bacterium]
MKTPILVDTCIVSYHINQHSLAEHYEKHLLDRDCFLSFQTVEELLFGAHKNRWGTRRFNELRKEITDKYKVFYVDPWIIELCAKIRVIRKNQPISIQDAWIAATALALSCPLLTHNARDFENIPGLEIITEYTTKN